MSEKEGSRTLAPCGCEFWVEDYPDHAEFMFRPHALDCPYWLYAKAYSEKIGHPVIYIEGKAE